MRVPRYGSDDLTGSASKVYHALGHPLRARAFELLCQGHASPVELARRMNLPLSKITYHVRVLAESGCAELVEMRAQRGAIEHIYAATDVARRDFFVLDEVAARELREQTDALLERARALQAEAAERVANGGAGARVHAEIVALTLTDAPSKSRKRSPERKLDLSAGG